MWRLKRELKNVVTRVGNKDDVRKTQYEISYVQIQEHGCNFIETKQHSRISRDMW